MSTGSNVGRPPLLPKARAQRCNNRSVHNLEVHNGGEALRGLFELLCFQMFDLAFKNRTKYFFLDKGTLNGPV